MTDIPSQTPDAPDTVTWQTSGIIVKQIVLIVVGVGSLAGIAFTPEQTAQITGIISAVAVIGFAGWTIHNRITRPCPPVLSKKDAQNAKPTNSVTDGANPGKS